MTPNIISDLKAKSPEELKQLWLDAKEYDVSGEKTRRLVDLAENHYGKSDGIYVDCVVHTLYRFLAKRYIQSIQSSGCVEYKISPNETNLTHKHQNSHGA